MAYQTQCSPLKIANFRQIVPPFLYEMIKAGAQRGLFIYKMTNQTQCSSFKIGISRQIVIPIFPSDDKGRARSAEMFIHKIMNDQPSSIFSLENRHFCQIVPLVFPSDNKGRACSAEMFSIYNSFSYGLLEKKGARGAEIFSIYILQLIK